MPYFPPKTEQQPDDGETKFIAPDVGTTQVGHLGRQKGTFPTVRKPQPGTQATGDHSSSYSSSVDTKFSTGDVDLDVMLSTSAGNRAFYQDRRNGLLPFRYLSREEFANDPRVQKLLDQEFRSQLGLSAIQDRYREMSPMDEFLDRGGDLMDLNLRSFTSDSANDTFAAMTDMDPARLDALLIGAGWSEGMRETAGQQVLQHIMNENRQYTSFLKGAGNVGLEMAGLFGAVSPGGEAYSAALGSLTLLVGGNVPKSIDEAIERWHSVPLAARVIAEFVPPVGVGFRALGWTRQGLAAAKLAGHLGAYGVSRVPGAAARGLKAAPGWWWGRGEAIDRLWRVLTRTKTEVAERPNVAKALVDKLESWDDEFDTLIGLHDQVAKVASSYNPNSAAQVKLLTELSQEIEKQATRMKALNIETVGGKSVKISDSLDDEVGMFLHQSRMAIARADNPEALRLFTQANALIGDITTILDSSVVDGDVLRLKEGANVGGRWITSKKDGKHTTNLILDGFGRGGIGDPHEVLETFIKNSGVRSGDRARARDGLTKLISGERPEDKEIVSLAAIFGDDFGRALMKKKTVFSKVGGVTLEVIGIPRTLLASMDLSYPFRQGMMLGGGHPIEFQKAFATMVKAWANPRHARVADSVMRADKHFRLFQESGGYVAEVGKKAFSKASVDAREEEFVSTFMTNIPFIRASERGFATMGNRLRYDVFKTLIESAQKKGTLSKKLARDAKTDKLIPGDDLRKVKDISRFLNAATGRGSLGPEFIQRLNPWLNSLFFSPRFMVSRIQAPIELAVNSGARGVVVRDIAAYFGTSATIASLLNQIPGVSVEMDPRSSSFGQVKYKNTQWDLWAGEAQLASLIAQLATRKRKDATTGKISPLHGVEKGTVNQLTNRLGDWLQNKLSPPASAGWDLYKGEDRLGESIGAEEEIFGVTVRGWKKEFYQRLAFLFVQDIEEAFELSGTGAGIASFSSFFGVAASSYIDRVDQALLDATAELYPGRDYLSLNDGERKVIESQGNVLLARAQVEGRQADLYSSSRLQTHFRTASDHMRTNELILEGHLRTGAGVVFDRATQKFTFKKKKPSYGVPLYGKELRKPIQKLLSLRYQNSSLLETDPELKEQLEEMRARGEQDAQHIDLIAEEYWSLSPMRDEDLGVVDYVKRDELREAIVQRAVNLGVVPANFKREDMDRDEMETAIREYITGRGEGSYRFQMFETDTVGAYVEDYHRVNDMLYERGYWGFKGGIPRHDGDIEAMFQSLLSGDNHPGGVMPDFMMAGGDDSPTKNPQKYMDWFLKYRTALVDGTIESAAQFAMSIPRTDEDFGSFDQIVEFLNGMDNQANYILRSVRADDPELDRSLMRWGFATTPATFQAQADVIHHMGDGASIPDALPQLIAQSRLGVLYSSPGEALNEDFVNNFSRWWYRVVTKQVGTEDLPEEIKSEVEAMEGAITDPELFSSQMRPLHILSLLDDSTIQSIAGGINVGGAGTSVTLNTVKGWGLQGQCRTILTELDRLKRAETTGQFDLGDVVYGGGAGQSEQLGTGRGGGLLSGLVEAYRNRRPTS